MKLDQKKFELKYVITDCCFGFNYQLQKDKQSGIKVCDGGKSRIYDPSYPTIHSKHFGCR